MLLWKKRWITYFLGDLFSLIESKRGSWEKTETETEIPERRQGRTSRCLFPSSSTQDKPVDSSPRCLFIWTKASLSNFTTSRKALGWGITLSSAALFQRTGMRFLAAKVFFKSYCFLWLPPSHKWLLRRMTTSETMQNSCPTVPQISPKLLNFQFVQICVPKDFGGGDNLRLCRW